MNRRLFAAATLLLTASVAPLAASEKGPIPVRSGVPTVVLSYAAYDRDSCLFQALPRLKIRQAPAHGTVVAGKSAHAIDKGSCAGKVMKSAGLQYRSTPGYRGPDVIVVEVESEVYTDGTGIWGDTVTLRLDVK